MEDNTWELLIKWYGYDQTENTWEPLESIFGDIPNMVKEFGEKHGVSVYNSPTGKLAFRNIATNKKSNSK